MNYTTQMDAARKGVITEAMRRVAEKENIYAESGMGCTGPVILVAEEDLEKSKEILKKEGFIH
jgi:thiamine biosynthesis protein ThiC